MLVATDVASKGLDFQDIQHVINYDMPDDVENYGMTTISCACIHTWGIVVILTILLLLYQ